VYNWAVAVICTETVNNSWINIHTGCFTTCGHYCRRWFPRSLWSNKFI